MSLTTAVKTEDEMLTMPVEELGKAMLRCILGYSTTPIKRHGLAVRFLRDYPRERTPESLYALEEALLWLEREMFIGLDPTEPELIFVTRRGKEECAKAPSLLAR